MKGEGRAESNRCETTWELRGAIANEDGECRWQAVMCQLGLVKVGGLETMKTKPEESCSGNGGGGGETS